MGVLPSSILLKAGVRNQPTFEAHEEKADADNLFSGTPKDPGFDGMATASWRITDFAAGTRLILLDLGLGGGSGDKHNQATGTGRLGYQHHFPEGGFLNRFADSTTIQLGWSGISNFPKNTENFDRVENNRSGLGHYLTIAGSLAWYSDEDTGMSAEYGVHVPLGGAHTDNIYFANVGWNEGVFGGTLQPPPKKDSTAATIARGKVLERLHQMVRPKNEGFFEAQLVRIEVAREVETYKDKAAGLLKRVEVLEGSIRPMVTVHGDPKFQGRRKAKKKALAKAAAYNTAMAGAALVLDGKEGAKGKSEPTPSYDKILGEKVRNFGDTLAVVEGLLFWLTSKKGWQEGGLDSFDADVARLQADLRTMKVEGSDETRGEAEKIEARLAEWKPRVAMGLARYLIGEKQRIFGMLKDQAETIDDMGRASMGKKKPGERKAALDQFEALLARYNDVFAGSTGKGILGLRALLTSGKDLFEPDEFASFMERLDSTARLANWIRTNDKQHAIDAVKAKYTIPALCGELKTETGTLCRADSKGSSTQPPAAPGKGEGKKKTKKVADKS